MKKIKKLFEKNDLIKIALIAFIVTVVLTWIIPYNYYANGAFEGNTLGRHGIVDIALSGYYGLNFFLQQILVVLCTGIFYGVISKTKGYQELTNKIARRFRNKTKLFAIISSLFVAAFTTLSTQTFVVLIFLPFIISIASKLKLDKITTFAISFGSLILSILGATYGTEGLIYFVQYLNYYSAVDLDLEIAIRFGVLAIAYLIFTVFTILHMRKVEKATNTEEVAEDLFSAEVSAKTKTKTWPMALAFYLLLILAVLGYINWSDNFGITIFDEFHEWLIGLKISKYPVISYILGSNAKAFGTWELYAITAVMGVILLFVSLISRVKLDDFIDNAIDGIKNVIKPLIVYTLINMVFAVIYVSPFTTAITSWLMSLNDNVFNPFIVALTAAINSLFHIDFGFTGYVVGELLTTTYAADFNIVYVIYVTITGLMAFIAPTSVILMIGLSYLNIPYKKWLKYIWKFFLIALVLLLILFSIMAYL